jgi:hypothetical protein
VLQFSGEILVRAWQSFLGAIGTTGLGFFASNVLQFFVMEVATHLVLWLFRGVERMRSHRKENLLIGALAYAIAVVTIYTPIYVRQVWRVNVEIHSEAESQPPAPSTSRHVSPPPFAYELSAPSIAISLAPQNGFTFDLSGTYSLEYKKQYLLTFANSEHKLRGIDVEIEFPYPVEAQKIVRVRRVEGVTFSPTPPIMNVLGAKIETNGCIGRWTYHLHTGSVAGQGNATVSLILNGWSAAHPDTGPPLGNGYIGGSFMYSYRGKTMSSGYYAVLEPSQDMAIKVSEPQHQKPAEFRRFIGFTVLAGPCIPDSSLLFPY